MSTFGFTEEQNELRSTAARFLDEKSSSADVRRLMETTEGFDEATWKQIADLGWTGMAIPESYGGVGFGFVELTVLMEEMGKKLFCAPYFSSVILATNAILNAGTEDQKKELLPGIADGTTRAALAFVEPSGKWEVDSAEVTFADGKLNGTKSYVVDGATANLLVVSAKSGNGISLYVVDPDADGVTRTPLQTLDMTRKQAKIEFSGTPAKLLGEEGAGTAALRAQHGIRHCIRLRHAVADGLGARRLRPREAQSRPLLACSAGRHRGQYARRCAYLVDGLWRRARLRTDDEGPPSGAPARLALARTIRGEGVPAFVAARRRRPALRRGGVASAALLAMRRVHGDRQVRTLRDDDRGTAVGVSGDVHLVSTGCAIAAGDAGRLGCEARRLSPRQHRPTR